MMKLKKSQQYIYGGVMEKYVLYITIEIIYQDKGMTTAEVKDFVVTFVVKLCGQKIKMSF